MSFFGVGCLAFSHFMAASDFGQVHLQRETNTSPQTAQQLEGRARLVGQLRNDRESYFNWYLDDKEADSHWRLTLELEGEGSSRVQVRPAADQETQATSAGVATFGQSDDAGESSEGSAEKEDGFQTIDLEATAQQPVAESSPQALTAGEYQIEVTGQEGEYRLTMDTVSEASVKAADPQEDGEQEPPQAPAFSAEPPVEGESRRDAVALALGETHEGSTQHQNWIRWHLAGENRLRLTVEHLDDSDGSDLGSRLYWEGESLASLGRGRLDDGEKIVFNQRLPAGDYWLELGSRKSSADYRVTASLDSPWAPRPSSEHPISLYRHMAMALPADGILRMPKSELGADRQWFKLPISDQPREVIITALGNNRLGRAFWEISNQDGETLDVESVDSDREKALVEKVVLPADQQWYLSSWKNRLGSIHLEIDDPALQDLQSAAVNDHDTLEIEVSAEPDALAAWADKPQEMTTALSLANRSDQPLTLPLVAHASQSGWQLAGLPEDITLEAGEQQQLTLHWQLPASLNDENPLSLFVAAGAVSASTEIEIRRDAAVNPSMREADTHDPASDVEGYPDLAWSGLGAEFVEASSGEALTQRELENQGLHYLNDGMSSAGSYLRWKGDEGEPLPPLKLAGDDDATLHTLVINQRSGHAPMHRWREVEVLAGSTLEDLTPVATLDLSIADGNQYFPLETPLKARYIRLRPLSFWGKVGNHDTSGIGLLQALGEPDDALADWQPNLLDAQRGGHWVYTWPDAPALREMTRAARSRFIPEQRIRQRGVRRDEEPSQLVLGFLDQRAAQLARVSWQDNPDWSGQPVEKVRLYTSLATPLGPWQHQADWTLERSQEHLAEWHFDEPVWARYLRLEIIEPSGDQTDNSASRRWRAPQTLGAFEAEGLGSGESILGYWGLESQQGPYESQHPAPSAVVEEEETHSSNNQRLKSLDQAVSARLDSPSEVRRYQVSVDEGHNRLNVRLRESQYGRLEASVHSSDGESWPLEWTRKANGWRHGVVNDLTPGDYHIELRDPRRAVAFLWDLSGSLDEHQSTIRNAIDNFAERLDEHQEVANVMPLDGPFLLADWAENATELRRALTLPMDNFTSSDAESALRFASRTMSDLQASANIVLITDGELVSRELSVWQTFKRHQPRIFAIQVPHGKSKEIAETRSYQQLMRSWAQAGDGHYDYAVRRTDIISAFEKALRAIRQPARFAIAAGSDYQAPPEPGQLRVISAEPEQPAVAAGVVQVIMDASGSMLRSMDGGRRIDVARDMLRQILDERLPDGVPVALRAYGHTEPHSCETELLVAPTRDHSAIHRAVDGIEAINLARTPLAASLLAVKEDLVDHDDQPRMVVLLTDGEETCDGDVEQAVDTLAEEGVDIRLNIVGFHIEELALQSELENLAALSPGGEYFSSQSSEELAEGLSQALAATWQVLDSQGGVIARGRIDDPPVALETGDYELVVDTQSGEQRQDIQVAPNQQIDVEVGDER